MEERALCCTGRRARTELEVCGIPLAIMVATSKQSHVHFVDYLAILPFLVFRILIIVVLLPRQQLAQGNLVDQVQPTGDYHAN